MKLLPLSFSILLLTLIISCKEKETPELFPDSITFNIESVEHIHLTNGRHIDLNPVMKVEELAVHDTLLLISGPSTINDYRLHIYNTKDGTLLNSLVSLGRGPDELLAIYNLQLLLRQKEFFYHDINSDRAIVYSLDSLLVEKIQASELISFNEQFTRMTLRLDSLQYISIFMANTNIEEGTTLMAGLYSRETKSLISRASFPHLEGMDSIINRAHIQGAFSIASGLNMTFDDLTNKIVIAYPSTDLIEVYDIRLNRLLRVHGPDRFFPSFEFSRNLTAAERATPGFVRETWPAARNFTDALVWTDQQKNAYIRPKAFPDGFYVMYDGGLLKAARGALPSYDLYFFHYDGTPQYRATFDINNRSIYSIDHIRGIIYVVDRDYEIYAYNLPRH